MTVLVTGASGFVGQHLVRCLHQRGERVVGTYTGEPPELPGVELHSIDLLDSAAMAALIRSCQPERIIHLAGLSHVGASWRDPAAYFRVNVLGTERLLEAAEGRRTLVASSAEVYGAVPEDQQPIGEETPLAPASPYAMTKACAERLALATGAVVVRTFNLVGPGQAANFALPAFARQLAAIARGEQEPVLAVGNLSARRDFVHVADGVSAYCTLAERGEVGRAYNIASGRPVSIAEALDRLKAVSGVEARVEEDPARMRPVDLPVLAGDSTRLEALGWKRQHDLDGALSDLWESVRSGAGG